LAITDIQLVKIVSGYRIRMEVCFQARLASNNGVQEIKLQQKEVIEAKFFALDRLPQNMLPMQREVVNLVGANLN